MNYIQIAKELPGKIFSLVFNAKNQPKKKAGTKTGGINILSSLDRRQLDLFKKEIANVMEAMVAAYDIYNPKRDQLTELQRETLMDAFLDGIVKNRILRVSNKKFHIMDTTTNKPDLELTKSLQKAWFRNFLKYAMESRFYGHSLIFFKKIELGLVKEIGIVDRRHVVPDVDGIFKSTSDTSPFITYTDPKVSNLFISAGDKEDLGLLVKASILIILKKHSWQSWDRFEEIYGIAIRIAKTASNDKTVLENIEKWLDEMGSAPYGVFP